MVGSTKRFATHLVLVIGGARLPKDPGVVARALRMGLETRHARPRRSPSRDPALDRTISAFAAFNAATRSTPNIMMAHSRPAARRSLGLANQSTDKVH